VATPLSKKRTETAPRGRKPTINAVSRLAFNVDQELQTQLEAEHTRRLALHRDVDWTFSSTLRALLRESLAAVGQRTTSNASLEADTTSKS
jgi:hypothetical protein